MGELWTVFRLLNARQLRSRRRRRVALTLVGLAIGVALLFAVLVINDTLHASVAADSQTLAGNAPLEVGDTAQAGLPPSMGAAIRSVPGVQNAIPVLQAPIRFASARHSIRGLGIAASPAFRELFPEGLGNLATPLAQEAPGIWLSQTLATQLKAGVGDTIKLDTPLGSPKVKITRILTDVPFQSINDGSFAMLPLKEVNALFDLERRVNSFYIRLRPGANVTTVKRLVAVQIGAGAVVGPPGIAVGATQRAFDSIAQLSTLASTAALIVGLLVIFNTMAMSVLERRRVIATTLALGVPVRRVLWAFMIEGALLGSAATVLGLVLGLLLAHALIPAAVSSYTFLPIVSAGKLVVEPASVIGVMGAGTWIAVAGAWLAARQATKIRPVGAMRPSPSTAFELAAHGPARATSLQLRAGLAALGLAVALAVVYLTQTKRTSLAAAAEALMIVAVALLLPTLMRGVLNRLPRATARAKGATGRLAFHGLAQQPGRTALAVGALGIAVGMVLAIGSAVNSFDTHVEGLTQHWFGSPLYVDAESANLSAGQPLPASLGRQLRATPGVRAALPWRYNTINWNGRPLLLYALPIVEAVRQGLPNAVGLAGVNQRQVQDGLAAGGVLVSRFTAHRLGIGVGDTVRIPTPGGLRGFRVAAVFEDVISYDSIVIDHEQYERIWHDSSVDRFAISPQPGETLAHLRPKLAHIVHADELEAEVVTRSQAVTRLFGVLKGTLALGRSFELVGLLVAAAIVFNTMLTAASERRWEFGLTRAIGMTRRGVSVRLGIESLGIGLLGSATALAIGVLLGAFMVTAMNTAFSWGVSYAPDWPTSIAILMLGVVIAVIAAVYPSRVSSRTTIISSLRLE